MFKNKIVLVLLFAFLVFSFSSYGQSTENNSNKSTQPVSMVKADEVNHFSAIVRPRVVEGVEVRKVLLGSSDTAPVLKSDVDIIAPVTNEFANELEKTAFELINQKRIENGLKPLAWDAQLARVARMHTENMARNNFFSHQDLEGKRVDSRANLIGYKKWKAIGENIAYNKGFKSPVETAVEGWMKSIGHRENILNPIWSGTAISVVKTPEGVYYLTQVFIAK